MDISLILAIAGFLVIVYFMNKQRIISNRKSELRMRGMAAVSRAVRPNEAVRIENQTFRDKNNKKVKIATVKIDDRQFDESELTPDIRGIGFEDELSFIEYTDEKGKRIRHERLRSEGYKNHNIEYWQQAKVLDAMTTADLVDLATAKTVVQSPKWTEFLDLLFTSYKGAVVKKDYKTFGEDVLTIALNQNEKPVLAIFIADGHMVEAHTSGINTRWENIDLVDVIAQLTTANP